MSIYDKDSKKCHCYHSFLYVTQGNFLIPQSTTHYNAKRLQHAYHTSCNTTNINTFIGEKWGHVSAVCAAIERKVRIFRLMKTSSSYFYTCFFLSGNVFLWELCPTEAATLLTYPQKTYYPVANLGKTKQFLTAAFVCLYITSEHFRASLHTCRLLNPKPRWGKKGSRFTQCTLCDKFQP